MKRTENTNQHEQKPPTPISIPTKAYEAITITYEKNLMGETKRDARWVVRDTGSPESEKFFYLEKGKRGAKGEALKLAQAYVLEAYGDVHPVTIHRPKDVN